MKDELNQFRKDFNLTLFENQSHAVIAFFLYKIAKSLSWHNFSKGVPEPINNNQREEEEQPIQNLN